MFLRHCSRHSEVPTVANGSPCFVFGGRTMQSERNYGTHTIRLSMSHVCEECTMQEFQGGCHCGALGIIYRTEIDPMYWRLRHDGCSFCRRHGVVGASDPAGNLTIHIEDPSKVRRYRFAHRTADFLICGECGVFVAAITDTAQGKRAVINARVLDGVSLDWAAVVDVHFDDESPPQRADRRSLHWTPVVT
jgi:hypothetical protein